MVAFRFAIAMALLATALAACADKVKPVKLTAIYVQPVANSEVIVFSDSEPATRYVEGKARSSYISIDGIFSAETIFRDLAEQGAHPILVTLANGELFDISTIAGKGAAPTSLSRSNAKLDLAHEDEKRIEGTLSYADKALRFESAFALQKGRYQLGITEASMPGEPPAPPEPENLRGQMMIATGLLRANVEEFYRAHDHVFPASFAEAGFDDMGMPSKVQSRKLGSAGVITTTFRADLPDVGGKTVVMTPHAAADGSIAWTCAAPGVPEDAIPSDCAVQ